MSDNSLNEDASTPIFTHLQALRFGLIRSLIAIFVIMIICFRLAEYIYNFLTIPIQPLLEAKGSKLVVLSPLEQAVTYIKLSFYCGIFGSIPIIIGEIWRFISPALRQKERHFLIPVLIIGTGLFAAGIAICYFIVLPFAMQTIMAWLPQNIEATISMEHYMMTALQLLLAFGLVFETPLIVAMLIISGLVKAATLAKLRKFYIVGAFITAALITPPDPLSQILMAIPLLLFFELGLLLGRLLKPHES